MAEVAGLPEEDIFHGVVFTHHVLLTTSWHRPAIAMRWDCRWPKRKPVPPQPQCCQAQGGRGGDIHR